MRRREGNLSFPQTAAIAQPSAKPQRPLGGLELQRNCFPSEHLTGTKEGTEQSGGNDSEKKERGKSDMAEQQTWDERRWQHEQGSCQGIEMRMGWGGVAGSFQVTTERVCESAR